MPTSLLVGAQDADRFERSRRVSWIDMEAVQRKKCLVVGAGALGNEVVKDLVLSGFRRITVVDMDHVVRSNLNRCLFFRESDVAGGASKASSVAERAKELYPEAEILAVEARIEDLAEGEFRAHDLVFGCLDNIAARMHLNAHSYLCGVPYIDGGTSSSSGKVQVVLPPDTPCLQCATNRTHSRVLEKRYSCSGSEVSYFEPKLAAEITTTSVIAAIQVREGLKIVSGLRNECLKHILFYNGLKNTSEVLEVPLDEDCPVHPR